MNLKRFAVAALGVLTLVGLISGSSWLRQGVEAAGPNNPMVGEKLGIHWTRGEAANHANPFGFGPVQLLSYHNGPVASNGINVQPIYWGKTWTDGSYKVSGLASFYQGVGGTTYFNTNRANSGGPAPSTLVNYRGYALDNGSQAPQSAPTTAAVLAEVQKMVDAGKLTVPTDGSAYYPVYVDAKRGKTNYCAWHSWGSVTTGGTSVLVQFGFFFNLDGDSSCDPQDTQTGNPQGLAALANVSGHELSEVSTDSRGTAWYDKSGSENADKCAWTFQVPYVSFGGRNWKIQSNWSNDAYNGSAGSPKGCVDSWP